MRYLIFSLILFAFVAPVQATDLSSQWCDLFIGYTEAVYDAKDQGISKDFVIETTIQNTDGRMRSYVLNLIDLAYDLDYSREEALSDVYRSDACEGSGDY